MTFTPPAQQRKKKRILILGSFPDTRSIRAGKPFHGPAESVLEECLHQAGLTKHEVALDNFIYDSTEQGRFWNDRTKRPTADVSGYRRRLASILTDVAPTVVIPLGEIATWSCTDRGDTSKIRGYPFEQTITIGSEEQIQIRSIPSLEPGKMVYGNYIWRRYLSHDLKKAKDYLEDPTVWMSPEVRCQIPASFDIACVCLKYFLAQKKISVDIEVSNFEVSCIGFSDQIDRGVSIPFDDRWSLEEEVELWRLTAQILEDQSITKVGQNFIFDIHFLAIRMGIITRGSLEDTMMAHSILYPDFLKGLEFLASIHTWQPYWKDMVKWKNPKKES